MEADLFSAGFAWDDVASDATPVATPLPPAVGPTLDAVSHRVATPIATDQAPAFSGDFTWSEPGVATVASVAASPVSHLDVAGAATPRATPETPGNADVGGGAGSAVASVAGVAEWRAGVNAMARAVLFPQIACCNWTLLLTDARSFLNLWGDDAAKLGWTTLELFGTNPQPGARRVDRLGLVQLLHGRPIQSIDRRTALIGRAGAEMTFDRRLVAAGGVAIWDLLSAEPLGGASRWRCAGGARKRLPPDTTDCQPVRG